MTGSAVIGGDADRALERPVAVHEHRERECDREPDADRDERQLRRDEQHESERERAAGDRIGQIHDRGSDSHANGAEVVRQTCHEIARPHPAKVRRIQRLESLEEIVAEVVLDPTADAVQPHAHLVTSDTTDE